MAKTEIKTARNSLTELIALVESLRGEDGCPWDKKQTPRSMLVYLIEEVYELADAVESNHAKAVCEELGDVLFHIFFIARLFQETGRFSIYDVAREITEKMIRRHPHVFGAAHAENAEEVRQNWQKIKADEKKAGEGGSVMDSVPKRLPALMRAYQVGERTARHGFQSPGWDYDLNKLESEFNEFKNAMIHNRPDQISEQFGRLLFSLVNAARLKKVHPEPALSSAVNAFEKRFRQMEKKVAEIGKDLNSLSPAEIEKIWKEG